ncbi:paired amphipathic helix protein Sin3-like 2 [Bidens hawaiensis]|uniref:paired amphipathic helix protein Sin3-like 2 n=1 Tax=Bidens hawaiensis TaxID=980011 RepID=UPI00404988AE
MYNNLVQFRILFQGKLAWTVSDAQQCLDKFKETLTPQHYDHFIDILKDYNATRIGVSVVKEKVIKLCEVAHQQLLLLPLFNAFIPQRQQIIFPQVIKNTRLFDALLQFTRNVKMKLQDDEHLYNCLIRILKWYKLGQRTVSETRQVITYLFHDHKDLLKEFNSLSSLAHSENATIASGSEPPRHDDEKEKKTSEKLNILPIKKRVAPILLEETVMSGFPQDMHEQVFTLNAKVKERLYQTEDYQSYLKCIKCYHSGNISRLQLNALVKDLLGAHPDLMEAFNKVIHQGITKIDLKTSYLNLDKAKEDEALNEKGRSKREILLAPGTKRSLILSNKDKNKAKPVREPNRTPSCRLIPCDFIVPGATQKRRRISKC